MLLTIRRLLSRKRSPEAPTPAPDRVVDERDVEAMWRRARAEPDPFRRDLLYEEVAQRMVELVGDELLRFCESHLGRDASRAEDVAQRALLTFWRVLPNFEERSSLKTFLFGIALNLCRRQQRDDARDARLTDTNEERLGQ